MNAPTEYIVGIRHAKRTDHVVIEAEDALIAALRVKAAQTDATITYVRRVNRRGDSRHRPRSLPEAGR